jgi:hypothetical protein
MKVKWKVKTHSMLLQRNLFNSVLFSFFFFFSGFAIGHLSKFSHPCIHAHSNMYFILFCKFLNVGYISGKIVMTHRVTEEKKNKVPKTIT